MIGTTLQNYNIEAILGEGGMGKVYKATDTILGRTVAIKCLSGSLTHQPSFLERFKNEAKTLARLSHPNIAVLYNYLQNGDDFYMVMEYVEGQNLDQLCKQNKTLPYQSVVPMMVQALDGLAHAHSKGVLHRDMKPANLMLTPNHTIKLMDFGIAKVSDQAKLTQVSRVIGTLEFLAPEIIEAQQPTTASDIYAAGVVMYELLTGRLPFSGKSDYMLMQEIVKTKPVLPENWNKELPASLSEIVLKALEKKPEDRFASATDFSNSLKMAFPELNNIPPGMLSQAPSLNLKQATPQPTVALNSYSKEASAHTTILQKPIPGTALHSTSQSNAVKWHPFLKNKMLYLGLVAFIIIAFALFNLFGSGTDQKDNFKNKLNNPGNANNDESNNLDEANSDAKVNNDSINFLLNKKKQDDALVVVSQQENNGSNDNATNSKKPETMPGSSNGTSSPKPSHPESKPQHKPKPQDKPQEKPKPQPKPEQDKEETVTLHEPIKLRGRGISINIALRENLTKEKASEGQSISFKVTSAGIFDDKVMIPAGSVIYGTIKGLGSRRMSIIFNSVNARGRSMRLERSEIGASMETVFSGQSFRTGLRGILVP